MTVLNIAGPFLFVQKKQQSNAAQKQTSTDVLIDRKSPEACIYVAKQIPFSD